MSNARHRLYQTVPWEREEIAHSPDASNKFAYDDSAQTFALYMMYWEKIK